MKFDRRDFLKVVAGGAVGTALTPLPWKLTDDLAIWTQNWPWVPKVARFPDVDYAATVCTLCEGGCGIKVRLVNSKKTVKVEGLESAPVNRGGVCPIGAAGPQYQYNLSRFRSPLKRLGARGSGAYTQISWEQAIEEVGSKLAEIRENGEAHTVVLVTGRKNDMTRALSQRFMKAYGSPNLISMPGGDQTQAFAKGAQFGWPGSEYQGSKEISPEFYWADGLGYDLENAELVLSFGSRIIEGWGSPVRSINFYSQAKSRGKPKLIQVDSYSNLTASKADAWIPVKFGTEGALALGLCHVIIKNNLYDHTFISEYSFGFEEFAALVKERYSPEQVEAITGLPADRIVGLAKEFAGTQPALAVAGKGRGDLPTPVYDLMAVQSLNALVGNINQKGGLIVRKNLPFTPWPEVILDEASEKGLSQPRLDLAGSDKYPMTVSLIDEFTESVLSGRFYPVSMVILDRANPGYFGSDPGAFISALEKVPYVVTLSNLGDDTSIQADIVLPETSNFEGPVDVVNPPTLPYPLFACGRGVMEKSPFDTKPAGDIYLALAETLGGPVEESLPFADYRDMLVQTLDGMVENGAGLVRNPEAEDVEAAFGEETAALEFEDGEALVSALNDGLFWWDPNFEFGDLGGAFNTPSGKFEFLSQSLQSALMDFFIAKGEKEALAEMGFEAGGGEIFLPHYEPYMPEGENGRYPLVMVPEEQFKLVTSWLGNAPYLTKLLEDTTLKEDDLGVHVNPETAGALHLHDGDKAWLNTPKGRLSVRLYVDDGIPTGVVLAPIGLGHRGYGYYLRGKGVNPMEVVEARKDPLSGQALWWGTPANLSKA